MTILAKRRPPSGGRAHGAVLRPALGAFLVMLGVAAGASGAALAAGADVQGAWGGLMKWPTIPIHMVMTRDGRVMSYGSSGTGQQTGNFVYDVWDPNDGPDGYHLTLPNGTSTDIFCSAQVLLPDSGDIMIAGGDIWNGTRTLNKGNDRSSVYLTRHKKLAAGRRMNRAR
jgi:hypothetical protein